MFDGRLEAKLGFDRVRKAISDRCSTEYAAQRTAEEAFSSDPAEISKRLELTDEMRLVAMFEDRFPSNGFIDCLGFLSILQNPGSAIDTLSLGKLRTMLDTLRKLDAFFTGIKDNVYPNLKKLASGLVYYEAVNDRIDQILDKFGDIKDTASDDLLKIRKDLKDKEGAISKRVAAVLRQAQDEGVVDSGISAVMRDGKILIPVPSSNKRKIQGFVYDQSASGKTTFIEPAEVVELENEISELHFAETREIARILAVFSDFLRPYIPDLMVDAKLIGEMDFLMAKAQVSLQFRAGKPIISQNGEHNLRKARHPLLEQALRKEGKEVVPLTLSLTPSKHILLISGPNAGGKSVCLKTTGLLQYMFQWGMLIPASETSELTIFDRIMVDIGDGQSIDNDLSTYSSFLLAMKSMLAQADSKTLVLIDEFGSGTEPAAGGAIAEAILSEFDRRGVYGVITTHYTNLKLYAADKDCGVANGAMEFDAANIAPLFKLTMGLPGNSFAFELARKMGLPEELVKDAESRAGDGYVGMERNLRKIARNRRALDEKLQKIRNTDKTLESITGKYQKELEDIRQTRAEILGQAKKEAEEIVRGANKKVENTIRTIRESQAEKEKTQAARKELQGFVSALGEKKRKDEQEREDYIDKKLRQLDERQRREQERKERRATPEERAKMLAERAERNNMEAFRNGPISVGEKVRVKDTGMVGEVSRVSSKAVTIVVGNMTTKVPADKVERISSNEYKAAVKDLPKAPRVIEDASVRERKLNFKPEIDVRGQRVNDALEIVKNYVDDAIMLGIGEVRILHGKGTGALREEIQKMLRGTPGVVSVKDEQVQYGGTGITIVNFG